MQRKWVNGQIMKTSSEKECELAQLIVDDLLGTCQFDVDYYFEWYTKDDAESAEKFKDANEIRVCNLVDEQIMCCSSCGWWVDVAECDDEGNCSDCQDEEF